MIHAHALTVGHMAETTCLMDVSHTASIGLRASGLSDNLRTATSAGCRLSYLLSFTWCHGKAMQ